MARVLVDTVAISRGVTVARVLRAFGKGDVLIEKDAVATNMTKEFGNFEGTILDLAVS